MAINPNKVKAEYLYKISARMILEVIYENLDPKNIENFKPLFHYEVNRSSKQKQAEATRLIPEYVKIVNKIRECEESGKPYDSLKKSYDEYFKKLEANVKLTQNPNHLIMLGNLNYYMTLDSNKTYELYDLAIGSLRKAMADTDDKIVKMMCRTDLIRDLALKFTISYIENDHIGRSALKEFLELEPKNDYDEVIWQNLAKLFNTTYNRPVGIKILEKLYSLRPTETNLLLLSNAYNSNKEYAKSIQLLKPHITGNNLLTCSWCNSCILGNIELDAVEKELDKVKQLSPNLYYPILIGFKSTKKDYDGAFSLLKEWEKTGANTKTIEQLYMNTYIEMKDFESALSYMKKHPDLKDDLYFQTIVQGELFGPRKKWECYENFLRRNEIYNLANNKDDVFLGYDQIRDALNSLMFCFAEDLANISNRSTSDEYEQLRDEYKEKIALFEFPMLRVLSLNKHLKDEITKEVASTANIFSPTVNPNFFVNSNLPHELNFETLPFVVKKWSKQPYVKNLFTNAEFSQIQSMVETALRNKDNENYSFADCLASLHTYVEKYTEPLYYYFLLDQLPKLQKEINELKVKIADLENERKNIKINLEKQKKGYQRYSSINDSMKEKIGELTREIDKRKREYKELNKMSELPNQRYTLGKFFDVMTINEKQPDGSYKKTINPNFKQFLQMHLKCKDIANPELFGLQLINNIEAYRYLRNLSVHNDKKISEERSTLSAQESSTQTQFRNWDSMEDSQIITKEQFFDLLNIALFSQNNIFYSLSQISIPEMYADKAEQFFEYEKSN